MAMLAAFVVLILFFGFLLHIIKISPDTKTADDLGVTAPSTPEEEERSRVSTSPESYLTIESIRGRKGGFETVLLISGRIRNSSHYDIKDPTISCDLFGPSGTKTGTIHETLLEIIPKSGSKRFRDLNMGFMGSAQVNNFECSIVGATALAV